MTDKKFNVIHDNYNQCYLVVYQNVDSTSVVGEIYSENLAQGFAAFLNTIYEGRANETLH